MTAQLAVGVLEMLPDGAGRDPEEPGHLGVRSPLGDELEDLPLTRSKQAAFS